MITCIHNEFSLIQYFEIEETIYCRWIGEVNSHTFRDVMISKLGWMQIYQPKSWVIDMKGMLAIEVADQQWLMETWFTGVKHNLERIAIIKPLDIYNEMVVETILDSKMDHSNSVDIQFFSDLESSLIWIKERSGKNLLLNSH